MDNNVLNGYGYFTKAFYPDLTLFPFAVIGYFTTLYIAYQSLIFTMTFLCGIFTYIAVYKVYKSSFTAAISSILFVFVQYRLSVMYYRGALGESMAITFIPLVLWGVYEILKGNYKKWYILTAAYFLLINTHVISAVVIFTVMLVFLAIYYKSFTGEPVRLKYLVISGMAALITCSYFLFPMLEQLFSNSFWATEKPTLLFMHCRLTMKRILPGFFTYFNSSRNIGIGGLLTAMLFLRFFIKGIKTPQLKSVDTLVIVGLICIFASWHYFPWGVFPFTLLHFIQFPWRFMHISIFLLSVAAGFYVSLLLGNQFVRKALFFLFIVFISLYGMNSGMDNLFAPQTPVIAKDTMDFPKTVMGAEYLPEKVPSIKYIEERGDKVASQHTGTEISRLARQKNGLSFSLKTNQKEILELPLIYYKGYRAELNNKELDIGESPNGLLEITADKQGEVKIYYAGTVIQKISVWITLFSLLVLIGYLFYKKYHPEESI
jgi:hypothetical protein